MRGTGRMSAVAACVALAVLSSPAAAAVPGPVQAPTGECRPESSAASASTAGVPYAQRRYDLDRLAPLADGAGTNIAVIDSGVDAAHPQLRGKVSRGTDFLGGTADGRLDCVGHGTGVASIMVATPATDVTGQLRGLAPAATVVPIRVSERVDSDGQASGETVEAGDFARAIDWAVDKDKGNATVINMSLVMTADHKAVRAAVRKALAAGVVIVAAVGNQAERGNPVPYPAAYPGVIGVGAIGEDGLLRSYSQHGPYVDLVAPGGAVTVASPQQGYRLGDGTSYAAPFVSATAALIRQRFPGLSPAEVARRLEATADPAPGGHDSEAYGRGILNPYRALTEEVPSAVRAAPSAVALPAADPALAAAQARRAAARSKALLVAGVSAVMIVVVVWAAVVLPRGRRRNWRPAEPRR